MFLQPIPINLLQQADGQVNEDFLSILASQVYKSTLKSFAKCLRITDEDYKSIVEMKLHRSSQQGFEASPVICCAY